MFSNGEYLLFMDLARERREKIEKELNDLARFESDWWDDDLAEETRRPFMQRLGGLLVTVGEKLQSVERPEPADCEGCI